MEAAEGLLAEMPSHWPARAQVCALTARALIDKNEFDEAEPWVMRGLTSGPNADLFALWGEVFRGRRELRKALEWYEAAVACNGDARSDYTPVLAALRRQCQADAPTDLRPVRCLPTAQGGTVLMVGEDAATKDETVPFESGRSVYHPIWKSLGAVLAHSFKNDAFLTILDRRCDWTPEAISYMETVWIDEDLNGIVWAHRYGIPTFNGPAIGVFPSIMADDLMAVTLRRPVLERLPALVAAKPADIDIRLILGALPGKFGFHAPCLFGHKDKYVRGF